MSLVTFGTEISGTEDTTLGDRLTTVEGESSPYEDPEDGVKPSSAHGSGESDDYPPLNINDEALKHIAECYLPATHGKCVEVCKLEGGTYHEICLLEFEDEWTCIARLTRNKRENTTVTESEIETRRFVRRHTSIPVPETYFANLDPANAVGAPFVLMEDMKGYQLAIMWNALKTDYRLKVLAEIARVIAQLARLHFNKFGSLRPGGAVGRLQNKTIPDHEPGRGPFSTTNDFMKSFLKDDAGRSAEVMALYTETRAELAQYMATQKDNAFLNPPYRLLHGDFDSQNMLFTWDSPSEPPRLSAIIDWDFSYTGPLDELYEYPIFIQDSDLEPELYSENKLLRKEFVRMLAQNFPKHSEERRQVRQCFRDKMFPLRGFYGTFAARIWTRQDVELSIVKLYLEELRNQRTGKETLPPYNGRHDWQPDSELESGDEES
ncbi:hypothetical protein B0A50_04628 [Salinomyces thailandicus]|uniref:Aminoglycoside phosphotransferase domain-containing protein n=1 Tax=Salinomyces thailandicus TaxID=706561 RepID=A0A4U0TUX2_9PEZI|nr:hypothetical protein B0A50_04628 [Salinomyces thailandica]